MRPQPSLALFLATTALTAGVPPTYERYGWAQVQLGYVKQENSACVRDAAAVGLSGGDWISRTWGWDVSALSGRLEDTAHVWKARETHFHASVVYSPFGQMGPWRPFVRCGAGISALEPPASLSTKTSGRPTLVFGAGTHFLWPQTGLASLELRRVNVRTYTPRAEWQLLAGIGLHWGHEGPAPTMVPAPAAAAPPPVQDPPPAPPEVKAPEPLPPVMPEPPPPSVPVPTPGPEPLNIAVPPASSVIVLSEAVLHFANNGSILPHQAATAIQEVVDQLKAYGGAYTLMVSGHTSSLGSKSHNYALSRLRAEAVVRLLVNGGIPVERVFAVGRGPDVPIADNRTPEGQSRNRRVEIEVKAGDSSIQKTRTSTALIDADEGVKPKGKDKPRE